MAQTPIWQRECAQVRESEGEIDAASRTSPLRIRTSSSAGYPITAGDSCAPIFMYFYCPLSNEYISAALALIPPAIAAMPGFMQRAEGLSGAADRGALEKGRAHAPAAFESFEAPK